MIYVYEYLGMGLAVLAVVYGSHRLMMGNESYSLRQPFEAGNSDGNKLSYRILCNVVVPVVAALLIVAIWPVVIGMRIKDLCEKKPRPALQDERAEIGEFAVERQHLLERLTVQEIENREVVTDPLNAVPALSFGHLNAAWKEFLNSQAAGAELWWFSARQKTRCGQNELRSGFVAVRGGIPGAYFLVVWKDVVDDVQAKN